MTGEAPLVATIDSGTICGIIGIHDRDLGQPRGIHRSAARLREGVASVLKRLADSVFDHGRIVIKVEFYGSLEAFGPCDQDAHPSAARVRRNPRFIGSADVLAGGNHGRFDSLASCRRDACTVENSQGQDFSISHLHIDSGTARAHCRTIR
jgi:hypothetical protein